MGNFYLAEKDFPVWDYFAIWLLDHYFYCNTYSRYMEAFPWEVLFDTWPRHHFIIGMLSTHSLLPILCMLVHRIIYSVQEHLKTKQYWVSWQHANNHTLLTYSRPVTKQTKFLLVRSSLVHVSWVGKHLLTKLPNHVAVYLYQRQEPPVILFLMSWFWSQLTAILERPSEVWCL